MSPKKAYNDQKHHAEERGIEWLFTYEEWLELWLESGKWNQRGKKSGQYVMARYGDCGPYSKRNCYICTVEENNKERLDRIQKINDSQAQEIAYRYQHSDLSQADVAKEFGVSQSYVSRLVNGKRRVNVTKRSV